MKPYFSHMAPEGKDSRLPSAEDLAVQARAAAADIDRLATPPWLEDKGGEKDPHSPPVTEDGWPRRSESEPVLWPLADASTWAAATEAAPELVAAEAAVVDKPAVEEEASGAALNKEQPATDPSPEQEDDAPVNPNGIRNLLAVMLLLATLILIGSQLRNSSPQRTLGLGAPTQTAPPSPPTTAATTTPSTQTTPPKTASPKTAPKQTPALKTGVTKTAAPLAPQPQAGSTQSKPTTSAAAKTVNKTAPKTVTTTATAPKTTAKPPMTKPTLGKPQTQSAPAKSYRTSVFTVAGAPRQKSSEMLLTRRVALLSRFLDSHQRPSNATVKYWLYQHAWVVTGALYGWPGGTAALEQLLAVDHRVEARWGIGWRSEALARNALAAVRARSGH